MNYKRFPPPHRYLSLPFFLYDFVSSHGNNSNNNNNCLVLFRGSRIAVERENSTIRVDYNFSLAVIFFFRKKFQKKSVSPACVRNSALASFSPCHAWGGLFFRRAIRNKKKKRTTTTTRVRNENLTDHVHRSGPLGRTPVFVVGHASVRARIHALLHGQHGEHAQLQVRLLSQVFRQLFAVCSARNRNNYTRV